MATEALPWARWPFKLKLLVDQKLEVFGSGPEGRQAAMKAAGRIVIDRVETLLADAVPDVGNGLAFEAFRLPSVNGAGVMKWTGALLQARPRAPTIREPFEVWIDPQDPAEAVALMQQNPSLDRKTRDACSKAFQAALVEAFAEFA